MYWSLVKVLLSLFICIVIPTYWQYYGPKNFLWLSDIALFLTVIALWNNSRLLMSIVTVMTLWFELIWCLDFFFILILKKNFIRLADYMFDFRYPLLVRLLSLFHIVMPIIWVAYLYEYGYDSSAIYYAVPLFWLILFLSYEFSDLSQNINWVFLPIVRNSHLSQSQWVLIMLIGFPLIVFYPSHCLFLRLFNDIEGLY